MMAVSSGFLGRLALTLTLYITSVRLIRLYIVRKHLRTLKVVPPEKRDIKWAHQGLSFFANRDLPFLSQIALEFALFRTYGVEANKLLIATGELVHRCPRRYDDTELLIREFTENILDTDRAVLALKRMNYLHGKYTIDNTDFVYTLALFITQPATWVSKYGWRGLDEVEKEATYRYWTQIGIKMGLQHMPHSYNEMERLVEEYETKYMHPLPRNVILANATFKLFLNRYPRFLQPVIRPALHSLCDKRLRVAMGFPEPNPIYKSFVRGIAKLHGIFVGWLMLPRIRVSRRTPLGMSEGRYFPQWDLNGTGVYKGGYKIEDLGPEKYVGDSGLGAICVENNESYGWPDL
ncbi:uncharacterized protein SPPG_07495 [Spizellomyces punctatus DAOM BR117]|uniref:ER-bound oxygenase mpaB/mpaB'/Rubber oxygenase catalytic domain-containing protein n=1 Tax=Spizellomyces punctatus (strain DAOM BR117) TaxID=645134 RepID=A0A0L0H848_SPIPD|nr:uncharacterized protein SPPG_07495 [Spizellomyces punctatus DAOM BR117]KNC97101.1 hypothetical protein SPPG_07495 [Spizellomyces punctatus DAOM BR117]|eukprot:XP_016605141.1 hypothetical protein SPPG_07495 [Spizellomyces punctatus DAOM BR117]